MADQPQGDATTVERPQQPLFLAIRRWREGKNRGRTAFGIASWTGAVVIAAVAVVVWLEWLDVVGVLVALTVLVLIEVVVYRPEPFVGRAAWTIPIAFFGVVALVAPRTVRSVGFYDAAVGIVPVLLLALVVETHALGGKLAVQRRTALYTVVYLIIAGYVGLKALASGNAEDASANFVIAALAASTVSLLLLAIGGGEAVQHAGSE